MKLLFSGKEASMLLGAKGTASREIGQQTGTRLHLSGRNEFYPGTQLQELTVRGPTVEPVAAALFQVMQRIMEDGGRICGGDADVEEGACRVRVVVPSIVAKAVIGKGGDNIKSLRHNTGLKVHIEEVAIGVGELAEQVVILQGGFDAMQNGLPNIIDRTMEFSGAPWFRDWAMTTNAGNEDVVATHMASSKGGKKGGKKGEGKGHGKPGTQAIGGEFNGWGNGRDDDGYAGGGGRGSHGGGGRGRWEPVAESSSGLDMVAGALSSLPASAASLSNRSQSLTFSCPMNCVSHVIGKGGAGTKEITAATGAKIMIREIDGNDAEKSVIITGSAAGVASAYLYVVGRIAESQERQGEMEAMNQMGGPPMGRHDPGPVHDDGLDPILEELMGGGPLPGGGEDGSW